MLDETSDVRKTFTDYQDENDIQFIKINVQDNQKWCNKMLRDLEIPPQTLVVTVERNGKVIIPNGTTTIEANDILILTAPSFKDTKNMEMSEIEISHDHDWIDKPIKDLDLSENTLIVMIKRNGNTIVPNGNTIILQNDILVLENIEVLVQ